MDYVSGKFRLVLIYLMTLCKLPTLRSAQRERNFELLLCYEGARGGLEANALRYKPADRGFDSRRCHWNFSVT